MVTFLPTPLGNINDITYRTLEVLKSCELILCEDTRVAKHLLAILKERFHLEVTNNIDIFSFHEHNGSERLLFLKERIKSENVVYMSDAGMPVISDPGQLLVQHCQSEGIAYDVLPGASVVPLIYAASGFKSGRFYFYGFLPHKGRKRSSALNALMGMGVDVILYEAPHRLIKLLEQICKIDAQRELFVAKELTKRYQTYYRLQAKDLLERLKSSSIKGEWAIVIAAKESKEPTLHLSEIKALDIPPKVKAKLIAKLTAEPVKECYNALQKKV